MDPARGSAKQVRPGSWNRYSYVRNNPMGLTDPSGMLPGQPSASGQRYVTRPANNGALDMILTMEKDIQSFDGRDGQEDQKEEQTQQDEQQEKGKQGDPAKAKDGSTGGKAGTSAGHAGTRRSGACGAACAPGVRTGQGALLAGTAAGRMELKKIDDGLPRARLDEVAAPEPYVVMAGKSLSSLEIVASGVMRSSGDSGIRRMTIPKDAFGQAVIVTIHGHPTGNACPSCDADMVGARAIRAAAEGTGVTEIHNLIVPRGEEQTVLEYDGGQSWILKP